MYIITNSKLIINCAGVESADTYSRPILLLLSTVV